MKGKPEFDSDNVEHELTVKWIKKANSDFTGAQALWRTNESIHFENICFLLQQAVEKYLKSILVFERMDFPKTHDINQLTSLLPSSVKNPDFFTNANKQLLNSAVAARYPDYSDDLTAKQVEKSFDLTRKVRSYTRNIFGPKFLKEANCEITDDGRR